MAYHDDEERDGDLLEDAIDEDTETGDEDDTDIPDIGEDEKAWE